MKNNSLQKNSSSIFSPAALVRAAVIAAIYVALCFVFAPISFGVIQVRVSEALTLLPVLCPEAIIGVTVGCFFANMLSGMPLDMIIGTLATLLAAFCSYALRSKRIKGLALPASLPPVLFNAVIIGAELTILEFSLHSPASLYLLNMASVGAGQIVSCCILGCMLVFAIEKNSHLSKAFGRT